VFIVIILPAGEPATGKILRLSGIVRLRAGNLKFNHQILKQGMR
jgi:hypothetical protein